MVAVWTQSSRSAASGWRRRSTASCSRRRVSSAGTRSSFAGAGVSRARQVRARGLRPAGAQVSHSRRRADRKLARMSVTRRPLRPTWLTMGRRGKPYTEIGADMSGRRRRDDGWDDGHQDAQDDRRDPWADNSVDEWGDREPDSADDAAWSDSAVEAAWANASNDGPGTGGYPARGGAGGYVKNDAAGKGYTPAPPSYPSFQAPGGNGRGSSAGGQASGFGSARNGDRSAAAPGYGGQREYGAANGYGASNGHGAAGFNGAGYQDSGYGRANNGGSRRDAAGYDAAPGGPRDGSAGGRNGYGYGANGRPAAPAYAPEFTPADNADMDDDGPASTPRPYGGLSIYTLQEDKTREFDRLAERAAEGVRAAEPDTLVYVIHVVPKAPMQRIIYEIYRDRAAFLTHERQPHIRQFAADRAPCVLATNIIDLRLKYAKVAALGSAPDSPMPPQASRVPRGTESAAVNDRQQTATAQPAAQYQQAQYQPAQYQPAQYQPTQYSTAQC